MINQEIIDNLFLIEIENDKYILYRPDKGLVSLINSSVSTEISNYLYNNGEFNTDKFIIRSFKEKGFFESFNLEISDIEIPVRYDEPFRPHEVTLDITWNCNLKCIYCYANGGDNPINMDINCGIKAINLCISNCIKDNKKFSLHFHGNGEPTLNWESLTTFIKYAKEKTKQNNIELNTSIATNGIMNKEKAIWISENIDQISLSYDGNSKFQNIQRPTKNNKNSFEDIFNTANIWKNNNKNFNIRITITKNNVDEMENMTKEIIENFPKSTINFEPMTICGRAKNIIDIIPDSDSFSNNFVKAFMFAKDHNVKVYYSGFRGFSHRIYFCGASYPHFSIMANGSITSCFSYSSNEPIKNLFIYGCWDSEEKEFNLNQDKISHLRTLRIDNDPYCIKCFAKYHCTGDCPAIRKYNLNDSYQFNEEFDIDFTKNRRCKINRSILKQFLTILLNNSV